MAQTSARYLELVSGKKRSPLHGLARAILTPPSWAYQSIIAARNAWYDTVGFAAHRVDRPVISIGNITVGGTGKTPMTAKVASHLVKCGHRVAILARGYKGGSIPFDEESRDAAVAQLSASSDEARVLKRRCPKAQVYLNANRSASADKAIEDGADCLLLDDGFQHRRVARDLDIVLIDATNPFGHGHLLPRGLLREPLSSLRRAGMIVITRSDEVSEAALAEVRRVVTSASGGKPVVDATQQITGYLDVKGRPVDGADTSSMQAVIFAGIGNFASFRRCVERLGVRVLAAYEFPDHHYYTSEEIEGLTDTAQSLEANALLTTEKDAVKLVGRWKDERAKLLVLNLEIQLKGDGEAVLGEAVERALSAKATTPAPPP
ncbi:MAG: tetraacyldisaccharide 4'-kinase [Planctomycetota bacterium]